MPNEKKSIKTTYTIQKNLCCAQNKFFLNEQKNNKNSGDTVSLPIAAYMLKLPTHVSNFTPLTHLLVF